MLIWWFKDEMNDEGGAGAIGCGWLGCWTGVEDGGRPRGLETGGDGLGASILFPWMGWTTEKTWSESRDGSWGMMKACGCNGMATMPAGRGVEPGWALATTGRRAATWTWEISGRPGDTFGRPGEPAKLAWTIGWTTDTGGTDVDWLVAVTGAAKRTWTPEVAGADTTAKPAPSKVFVVLSSMPWSLSKRCCSSGDIFWSRASAVWTSSGFALVLIIDIPLRLVWPSSPLPARTADCTGSPPPTPATTTVPRPSSFSWTEWLTIPAQTAGSLWALLSTTVALDFSDVLRPMVDVVTTDWHTDCDTAHLESTPFGPARSSADGFVQADPDVSTGEDVSIGSSSTESCSSDGGGKTTHLSDGWSSIGVGTSSLVSTSISGQGSEWSVTEGHTDIQYVRHRYTKEKILQLAFHEDQRFWMTLRKITSSYGAIVYAQRRPPTKPRITNKMERDRTIILKQVNKPRR